MKDFCSPGLPAFIDALIYLFVTKLNFREFVINVYIHSYLLELHIYVVFFLLCFIINTVIDKKKYVNIK